MRLKRLCEKKKSGKMWVSSETHEEYCKGGASRETLEIALLETLRALGPGDDKPDRVRVGSLSVLSTCL